MSAKLDSQHKLEETARFLQMWREFFRQMEEGVKAPIITQELESEFLKIKTRICARKQMLQNAMDDQFDVGSDAVKVLYETVSLDALRADSQIRMANLKSQWHEIEIALNRLIGILKEEVAARGGKSRKK